MPYDDPDATDPMTLHGVVVETTDSGPMRDMAECFIQEYLRSGFDADRILGLFKTRSYAGPFLAYQTLGENTIREMIDKQSFVRSRPRTQVQPDADAESAISLPVLDR